MSGAAAQRRVAGLGVATEEGIAWREAQGMKLEAKFRRSASRLSAVILQPHSF